MSDTFDPTESSAKASRPDPLKGKRPRGRPRGRGVQLTPQVVAGAPVLLTREQACQALGVSLKTLKRLVTESQLHEVRIGKFLIRIAASEIQRFIDSFNGGADAV